MKTCLGIYIQKDFIQYVKIQKEQNNIKIISFNHIFYKDLETTLVRIINETNSSKIPISINISDEFYNVFYIEASVNRKEIKNSVDMAFNHVCNQKNIDIHSLDTRYILQTSDEKENNYEVLHVATRKENINKKQHFLKDYLLQSITPVATSLVNLLDKNTKENLAIVNIGEKTTIIFLKKGKIYKIDSFEEGINEIFEKIQSSEITLNKAYNIYKNLSIYNEENTEYLEEIIPILYNIVIKTKNIIDMQDINKIYITGLGASIKELDKYFEEYLLNVKCEVLKPFFLENNSIKTPMEDYIEVNSAMALALNGVGYLKDELNFQKTVVKASKFFPEKIEKESSRKLTPKEKLMIRISMVFIIFMISFLGFSNKAYKRLEETNYAINRVSTQIQEQYALMENDLNQIQEKTLEYESVIETIKTLTEVEENTQSTRIISKDAIPNMLNKIMNLIPEQVKIISIKNESNSKRIFIEVESQKYEQLGYFSSLLKTENVLENIKSSSGYKEGEIVRVIIEGELP